MEEEKYKEFVDTLYHYKIGIRYFDEGFGIEFFGYIILDSLLLLVLCINKNILIGNGLWDKREEQIESIYLANERVMKFKDINTSIIINKLRLLFCEMYYTMLMGLIDNKRDKYKKDLKLKSLKDMNVYVLVNSVPKNFNVISCRWVFKYKRDSKGNIIKRKARLVARGFTQQYVIDF